MIGRPVTYNGVTINNHAAQPLLWAQSPYYFIHLDSVDGLYSADISYESHPVPFSIGEVSGDVFRRGKSLTLTGKIRAMNLRTLEEGADVLGSMFADKSIKPLSWTRWSDGVAIYIACRINNDLSIAQTFQDGKYEWQWTVGLRADDPRTKRVSDGAVYPSYQQ